MAKDILVIGDSNVQRYYTRLGQLAQGMDFTRARNVEEMQQAFTAFKESKVVYKIIVLAFISNMIVSAGEEGSSPADRLSSIEGLFNEVIPIIRLDPLFFFLHMPPSLFLVYFLFLLVHVMVACER